MDFYQILNDQLRDEYNDVITYTMLSKEAKDPTAQVLRDIAREEYVHSKHLKDILLKSGKLMEDKDLENQATEALDGI